MARAAEIVALRGLGLRLKQVARVLDGKPHDLDGALAVHEARLSEQGQADSGRPRSGQVAPRRLGPGSSTNRCGVGTGGRSKRAPDGRVLFALAVGWGVVCPTRCSQARVYHRAARQWQDALRATARDRVARGRIAGTRPPADTTVAQRLADDAVLAERVERKLAWLAGDGAERSAALIALVVALEAATPAVLVIDMVEEGLSTTTQTALMAHLRLQGTSKRALFLMTRSSVILDLDELEPTEVVILCPANHSAPLRVVPYPGGRGYEAVATCVAPPGSSRHRTAGIVAMRPDA